MSLQFIIGGSGTGKSWTAYHQIISESVQYPEKQFYVIVPEQFTMQTQKTLVDLHPGGGILNIDVLSFQRLVYRIFEETGGDTRRVLEDTGKGLVLRRIVQEQGKRLSYLGGQMKKPGCIDEMKSLISEFAQYAIHEEELLSMLDQAPEHSLLSLKLQDISVIYKAFREFLADTHVTAEELLETVLPYLPASRRLAGSVMLLDGFTGFTPVQLSLLRGLLSLCSAVRVTVTMDPEKELGAGSASRQLFGMSHAMIRQLSELTDDIEDPVLLYQEREKGRFAKAPALGFLEQHLFRYDRSVYPEEELGPVGDQVSLFFADNPTGELEEIAHRIRSLVRRGQARFGEIAVITGNLEEYASLASQIFGRAKIPCFIDEKYNILMNPFVEYLRAALEMIDQDFTYESVFRFLCTDLSDLDREEVDALENYCLAMGIRGWHRWSQKWVRLSRQMNPADILKINGWRETFVEGVRPLVEGFSGKGHTVREDCVVLYDFLAGSRIQEKLKLRELDFAAKGNHALEKEYAQIYGVVMGLLEKLVEILGEETISRKEFRQLLETGLGQQKIALIPASIDQVLVGDMERTRLKDIRVLFFAGVNEGSIPKNTQTGGFLSEMDRDFFADRGITLAPDPKERILMGRFYLYLNMAKPSGQLCLSYSLGTSGGEPLRPASLIGHLKELFPGLTPQRPLQDLFERPEEGLPWLIGRMRDGEACLNDPLFLELYGWYLREAVFRPEVEGLIGAFFSHREDTPLGRAVAKALYGEISPYAATRLERYCACACAHFLQYGLRLMERERYEFRAVDMGNVMHEALQRFSESLRRQGLSWQSVEDEKRDTLIQEAVDQVVADYGNAVLFSDSRTQALTLRAKRILKRTVWALQRQLIRGTFQPEYFELPFEGGRIDRVDIDRDGDRILVKVMDYKSGSTAFDLGKVYHGLQLQLVLYLDAAVQAVEKWEPGCQVVPAGVFYYNIKDPIVETVPDSTPEETEALLLKQQRMNGLAAADQEILRRMDETLESLPVSVKKDGTFSKTSVVARAEQFQALNAYVKNKLETSIDQILEGRVEAAPYQLENQTPCTWCAFRESCGFDRRTPGYSYRLLEKLSKDEVWTRIGG